MRSIGLVPHPDRVQAHNLAASTAAELLCRGIEVRLPAPLAPRVGLGHLGVTEFGDGLDLVMAFGGDGTMLHAVHLVYPLDVPILGVNAGRLGYLTSLDASEAAAMLPGLIADPSDEFDFTTRMVLEATIVPPEGPEHTVFALNEVVIEKVESGRLVDIEATISDSVFTTFSADGVIVATPTGSTAYAFSVGGPIVSPSQRCMIVAPVAPHMLFDRTLVLADKDDVEFRVGSRPVSIAIDGQNGGRLAEGTFVRCAPAEHSVRIVTRKGRGFLEILREKFDLSDRTRRC